MRALTHHRVAADDDSTQRIDDDPIADHHPVSNAEMPRDFDPRGSPDHATPTDPCPKEAQKHHTPPVETAHGKLVDRALHDVPDSPEELVSDSERADLDRTTQAEAFRPGGLALGVDVHGPSKLHPRSHCRHNAHQTGR
jgi:hypothetical protein